MAPKSLLRRGLLPRHGLFQLFYEAGHGARINRRFSYQSVKMTGQRGDTGTFAKGDVEFPDINHSQLRPEDGDWRTVYLASIKEKEPQARIHILTHTRNEAELLEPHIAWYTGIIGASAARARSSCTGMAIS